MGQKRLRQKLAISIHALLAESDLRVVDGSKSSIISIHALLAESDVTLQDIKNFSALFLSTLSLRRATLLTLLMGAILILFLSTLSLRRATCACRSRWVLAPYFYPRSPCGERHMIHPLLCNAKPNFYPRSPCGERRARRASRQQPAGISIHALLAESDVKPIFSKINTRDFYPRSPCGERPPNRRPCHCNRKFLSTLSLRRATSDPGANSRAERQISIHALLAESDVNDAINGRNPDFISIHALLAESDTYHFMLKIGTLHFYPRSPCGERRRRSVKLFRQNYISIHALLAESDY